MKCENLLITYLRTYKIVMKYLKIFILQIILSCCILTAFAEYKPIPENLGSEYKIEMEEIINREYPNVVKNADNCVNKVKRLHDKIIQYGYDENNYNNMIIIKDVDLFASDLKLYVELMKITQEKYLNIKYKPIATDNANSIYTFLYPYFIDNSVELKKLDQLDKYINKKIVKCEKYINHIHKLFLYKK